MPATYSINDNTVHEATRVASVSDALNLLPDNTSKLISPRDVRDAIFSAWESSVFKQTTGSASVEYIGIDRDNIRNKFLIGKKRIGNIDVLNSTLLNYSFNDTDIFFFNNKPGITPSNTKISFLAGTNSYLYPLAPYFNSYSSTSSTLNLDIVNQTGDIILDAGTIGRIGVNNVIFPTKTQTASASNGQILKYNNGALVWGDNIINIATIGSTSSVTNIWGSPVFINDYNMEFTSYDYINSIEMPIIATFGHIPIGQTFGSAPIVEVVRQMLYPYLDPIPVLSINVDSTGWTKSGIGEYGSLLPSSIDLGWSITKRSDNVISSNLIDSLLNPQAGFGNPTVSYLGLTSISGVATGTVPSGFSETYTLSAQDSGISRYTLTSGATSNQDGVPNSVSDSVTLDLVYPYFWGVDPTDVPMIIGSVSANSILSNLTKAVERQSNKTSVTLSGTGYIYFMYPVSYGYLGTQSGDVAIRDGNGFDISSSFTYSIMTLTSPSSYWGTNYLVYKHGPVTMAYPSSINWQFKY